MSGISFGWVQSIQKDNLNLPWIAARFVPGPLSLDQKENCVGTCQVLPEILEWDPDFFLEIITGVRHGCMGRIQKPSSSCPCGRACHFHAQRMQDKFTQVWSVLSCELWICCTRTNCKPQSLCCWQLQEICNEIDLEIWIQGLVFPPWQCTFLAKSKMTWHSTYFLSCDFFPRLPKKTL